MKSEYAFLKVLADDLARRCSTSATKDLKRILGRIEHEGLSFLTITLPTFGKDFEKSLDQGYVSDDLFLSFKKSGPGGLPVLLQGFLRNVFSASDGVLLTQPCVDSIQAIRQITLLFSKVSLPCSDARTRKAIRDYVECEQEVRCTDQSLSTSDMEDFRRVSRALYRHFFTDVDREIYYGNVVPKHGPGSTADKMRANAKYRLSYWTDRLEDIFPAMEFILPNYSYWEKLDDIVHLEPGAEIPVEVTTVPKTLKTPRVIAMEPTAMQYAQQGVLELFLNVLGRKDAKGKPVHRALSKMIGIDDQDPNRSMAQIGSQTGALATLDLSEASDRVSNQQVRELTHDWPHLSKAIDATRSRKADVPGHGVIRLAKYASMGSALCFPMEAMVFLTMIFIGIEREHRTHIDSKLIKSYEDKVRVFGDDIIVPEHVVHSVVSSLTTFGSKVNTGKSFWTGKFRESCGKEYYDGHDVSIVKVRQLFPTQRNRVQECISIVSLRNQLYWAGLWRTAGWLDNYIRSVLKHYPVVEPTSPVLGRESVLPYQAERTHEHYHSPLVKGYVVSSNPPVDRLDDWGALLKFLLKRGGLPSVDSRHLERAGRPHAVNIKLRWASPF